MVMASVGGSVGSGLPVAARTAPLGVGATNVGSTEISPSGGVPSSVGAGVALWLAAGSAARTAGTTAARRVRESATEATDATSERFT